MLKNISKLGKSLDKTEQQKIAGGRHITDCTGWANGIPCYIGSYKGVCHFGVCC